MINRLLLGVMALLLILALIGYCTRLNQTLTFYARQIVALAENVGIIMMLVNGTFIRSRLYKIAQFIVGLVVVGFLFKILHWQGADELLFYPFIILFCLYGVHFINKKPKRRLDVLKVAMTTSFLAITPLVSLYVISEESQDVFFLFNHSLFWLTFLYFLYTSRKQGLLLVK